MSKKKMVIIGIVHFIWAVGLCLGAYCLEYIVMAPLVRFGVMPVVAVNVAMGIVLFLAFYQLERKLIREHLTKKVLYILATYLIPLAYQWIIVANINNMQAPGEAAEIVAIIYSFACLYVAVIAITRGIIELLLYISRKRNEKKQMM